MSCKDNGEGPCCGEEVDPVTPGASTVVLSHKRFGFSGFAAANGVIHRDQYRALEELVEVFGYMTGEVASARLLRFSEDYVPASAIPSVQYSDRELFNRLAVGGTQGSMRYVETIYQGVYIREAFWRLGANPEQLVAKYTVFATEPKPDIVSATLGMLGQMPFPAVNVTKRVGVGHGETGESESAGGSNFGSVSAEGWYRTDYVEVSETVVGGKHQATAPPFYSEASLRCIAQKSRLTGRKYRTVVMEWVGPFRDAHRFGCEPNVLGDEMLLFPALYDPLAVAASITAQHISDSQHPNPCS